MSKPTFEQRCLLAEQCLPDAPYRAMLKKLHTEMLEALAEQPAQKRPQNCGTSYCSCIECVMEPAQPQQEPVGEVLDERGKVDWISFVPPTGTLLYTVPPQRQPLTDEEIDKLMTDAARYRKLVAMEAALVEPVMIWHYLRNPDDLDTAHDIKEQA